LERIEEQKAHVMGRASFFWWSFGLTKTNKRMDQYKNEF
jgi:hypothetical protein